MSYGDCWDEQVFHFIDHVVLEGNDLLITLLLVMILLIDSISRMGLLCEDCCSRCPIETSFSYFSS